MPHTLVPSDRVEGAPVYGSDGTKIGTIERLMLDKRTGMVAYAVVKKEPGLFWLDKVLERIATSGRITSS